MSGRLKALIVVGAIASALIAVLAVAFVMTNHSGQPVETLSSAEARQSHPISIVLWMTAMLPIWVVVFLNARRKRAGKAG